MSNNDFVLGNIVKKNFNTLFGKMRTLFGNIHRETQKVCFIQYLEFTTLIEKKIIEYRSCICNPKDGWSFELSCKGSIELIITAATMCDEL